ncbi:hypothetical protein BHYA_0214g00130 [Botrytis hyacinthi]|uniref:Aromatic prenyltransferase (DMATS family) n=1 Tax=Botrytis hyacinthi TaxID=278943 RepID=A0A4Z1GF57_9HELO|nr:hypothetical protein BHYA_0214g00130 [Botrytis hyacinthi]
MWDSRPDDESSTILYSKQSFPKLLNRPWNVLLDSLSCLDRSSSFWWQMTGGPLSVMLDAAGYDDHSQYPALLFYFQHIIHRLGNPPTPEGHPHGWQSFMTDDCSPIEYSWTWGATPRIRYAVEAIAPSAGSSTFDPYNQLETIRLVEGLKKSQSMDWQLFEYFRGCFLPIVGAKDFNYSVPVSSSTNNSSVMLAFEPWKGKINAKAYVAPIKAYTYGNLPLDLASSSFRKLELDLNIKLPAYGTFHNFLGSKHGQSNLTFLALAVDCIDPLTSRFKLYVRSIKTAFDDVCYNLTMGEHNHSVWTKDLLSELQILWYLTLGLATSFPTSRELPSLNHDTAGILYNYDIHAVNNSPDVKVYIPVRHYGRSDLDIAKGLGLYLQRQGCDQHFHRYLQMLKQAFLVSFDENTEV